MSTLIQRLREYTTEDEHNFSITHPICDEAADALEKALSMLQRLEWCAELPASSERDTFTACPVCGEGSIVGLPAAHASDCNLEALLRELAL